MFGALAFFFFLSRGKYERSIGVLLKRYNCTTEDELENFLDLSRIAPLQSAHTQTADDRKGEEETSKDSKEDSKKSGIEPLDNQESTKEETETTEE